MNAFLNPEIVIYEFVKNYFNVVRDDFLEKSDNNEIEKSLLYQFFNKDENDLIVKFESFNYFTQSVELFVKKQPKVFLGYDLHNVATGMVHILLGNEDGQKFDIGVDEGYIKNDYQDGKYVSNYVSVMNVNMNLFITSENSFEVLLIYKLLKAGILSMIDNLELQGFRNISFSGSDIMFQSDLVPTHIFHRNLTLKFFYEFIVPNYFKQTLISKMHI